MQKNKDAYWEIRAKLRYEHAKRAILDNLQLSPEDLAAVEDILANQVPKDQAYKYDPDADGRKLWEKLPDAKK